MIWDDLLGHQAPIEMFRHSIERGRFAHGYLLVGPEGIGKRRFAEHLVQCLFCETVRDAELDACGTCPACKSLRAGTHPDVIRVGLPEGKNVLPIDLFVGAKERRGKEGLCFEMSLRPMAGRRKAAIIDDADHMNTESANALLKTLEEPPEHSVLFLIAASLDSVLPTIRSRCQTVRFDPLPVETLAALVQRLGLVETEDEARTVAAASDGSLAQAQQLVDPALRDLRGALFPPLARADFSGLELAQKMTEGVEAIGGDPATQRRTAGWIVRFAIEFYRQVLLALSGQAPAIPLAGELAARLDPADPTDLERIGSLLERTMLASDQLEQNVGVPLCLEALFDDLARLNRSTARV